MNYIVTVLLGIVCIVIGFSNRKGNISMLHAYHRKRVTEENRIPFGKMVGLGMIINGLALSLSSGLFYLAEKYANTLYTTIGNVIMIAGLAVGLGITFYAMKKYNNGIF